LYEDSALEAKGFFSWGKSIKKWLKKRVLNIFKKLTGLKKNCTADQCAYTAVKFKRKIDKYYNTGDIEILLSEFDEHLPKDPRFDSFDAFKDRIRYYHYNKHARPQHSNHDRHNFSVQYNNKDNSDNKKSNELEKYPIRSVFGGLEVACGVLIAIIPFPFCWQIGSSIVFHGAANIYEGYMQKLEEGQKDKNKNLTQSIVPFSFSGI